MKHNSKQMAKRVPALVKPALLKWARTSAGYSEQGAAAALKMELDDLMDWEAGIEHPSIPQLRELAALYRRPLSVFFLQEVPSKFQAIADFRRDRDAELSPSLTQEIRHAMEQRVQALELMDELGISPKQVGRSLDLKMDADAAGDVIRSVVGLAKIRPNIFGGDREGYSALRMWRAAVENTGILVFQTTRIASEEASGFAIADSSLPVIVINRKDPPTRRLFSLAHELSHILLHSSGVSDLKIDSSVQASRSIENFCNRAASAALMPNGALGAEDIVQNHGRDPEWEDEELVPLARRYGVSREALLVRLLALGRTNWAFYTVKRAQYAKEREAFKEKQKADAPLEMKRNIPRETLTNYGRSFVELVLGNYFQDRLTLNDVSRFLNMKTRHVEPLQKLLSEAN